MPSQPQPSSFTIRELTGQERTLRLAGRALPYQGVSFSGTMRAEFTWYPGNPEATVQLLGAAEDETTINGMWKDRFIGQTTPDGKEVQNTAIAQLDGVDIADAMKLCQTVDDFRRQGQLVEVTWDEIRRHGIITRFVQKWIRRQDVEWELTFGWISQGEPTVPAVFANPADLSDVNQTITSNVSAMQELADTLQSRIDVAQDFLGNLNDKIVTALQTASNVTDALAGTVNDFTTSTNAAWRISSALQGLQDDMQSIIDVITQTPAATAANFGINTSGSTPTSTAPPSTQVGVLQQAQTGAPNGPLSITVGKQLSYYSYVRSIERQARITQRLAARRQQDILKSINPDIIGVFFARDATDLRNVSTQFYGTPNEWKRIAAYNNITTGSALTAGQIVFIPILQQTTTTANNPTLGAA